MRRIHLPVLLLLPLAAFGQEVRPLTIQRWLSFSANTEAAHRQTQFFSKNYQTAILQWDSRAEIWLPPFRGVFAWGPYARIAGVTSSRKQPWENAWLAAPGGGVQAYPFSYQRKGREPGKVRGVLGPLRLFGEVNHTQYWGAENAWRPAKQVRAGMDYWKSFHVNDPEHSWWSELWNGAYWQSANEFSRSYDTVIVGNAVRAGIRKPGQKSLAMISPYLSIESSRNTRHKQSYWENRLVAGVGLRIAPSLPKTASSTASGLSRLILYGEYLNTATYYGVTPESSIPRYDFRFGVSASLGDWYK